MLGKVGLRGCPEPGKVGLRGELGMVGASGDSQLRGECFGLFGLEPGGFRITDFEAGIDGIDLTAFDLSAKDVGIILDRAEDVEGGGTLLDLTAFGGGSVTVLGEAPEAGDFLLPHGELLLTFGLAHLRAAVSAVVEDAVKG